MGEYILDNGVLQVTVTDHGAELVSVVDQVTGRERIWTADPSVWNRHAPILFPFVGKVNGGAYRYAGDTYEMKSQHGFARDREFTCVRQSRTAVTHCLKADAESRKCYPFDFALYVTHELSAANPRVLEVRWEIVNEGAEEMYYSIGGHPGFLVPEREGEAREDYWLEFPGKEELSYILVNPANGLAVPETSYELALADGRVPIAKDMFDRDALIFEQGQVETVRICRPDQSPYVTMDCAGFPYLGVWSKPDGPFVCLEPWVGRTDDDGFAGDLTEKTGEQRLAAGERREITYRVEFHG